MFLFIYVFFLSVNQLRIRDTVEENENMFEIHRLENVKILSGELKLLPLLTKFPLILVLILTDGVPKESGGQEEAVSQLRISCESYQEKNLWVSTINTEIRQLKSLAKSLAFD